MTFQNMTLKKSNFLTILIGIIFLTVPFILPNSAKMSVIDAVAQDTSKLEVKCGEPEKDCTVIKFPFGQQKEIKIKIVNPPASPSLTPDNLTTNIDVEGLKGYVTRGDSDVTLEDDTFTLTLKHKGKPGTPTEKLKVKYKISENPETFIESQEIELQFGLDPTTVDLKKVGDDKIYYGQERKFTLDLPDDFKPKITFDDNEFLKVINANNPNEITFQAIKAGDVGVGQLKVNIEGFSYDVPKAKITVEPDELQEVYLQEGEKKFNPTANGIAEFDIPLPEKKSRTFKIMGKFKSGQKRNITGWFPSFSPDIKNVPEGEKKLDLLKKFDFIKNEDNSFDLKAKSFNQDVNFKVTADFKNPDQTNFPSNGLGLDKFQINVGIYTTDYELEVSAPNTGNRLFPGGSIKVETVLRKEGDSNRLLPDDVSFRVKNPKEAKWIGIVEESASATVLWRNPTPSEIRKADGIEESNVTNNNSTSNTNSNSNSNSTSNTNSNSNNNSNSNKTTDKLLTRPPFIELEVTATIDGETLTEDFYVSFVEVDKFAKLDVKLNIMDERTVKDLYGSITAKDYYVLSVRLFNNLLDEDEQPTGNSIIAYSGSMEIAVGMEKKYLPKSNSSFARVLSKEDMEEINNASANNKPTPIASPTVSPSLTGSPPASPTPTPPESLESQYNRELKAAEDELAAKVRDASKKIRDYEKAANKYEDNINQANYATAQQALTAARDAIYDVKELSERVYRLRENIARWEYVKRANLRSSSIGPDTAINDGKWHPVTRGDLSRLVRSESLVPRFDSFLGNRNQDRLLKPNELKELVENREGTIQNGGEEPTCFGTITYRPLTFEMVVNTVDRRDSRSRRSQVFQALNFFGSIASFGTSFIQPEGTGKVPLYLEKYSNLLIPGLNKLYPSAKEQHRQNIVSHTMKPIEEIPYGADLTRVVFIPKRSFRGLIRGHATRISEICPYFFKIDVAVIKNSGTFESGTRRP